MELSASFLTAGMSILLLAAALFFHGSGTAGLIAMAFRVLGVLGFLGVAIAVVLKREGLATGILLPAAGAAGFVGLSSSVGIVLRSRKTRSGNPGARRLRRTPFFHPLLICLVLSPFLIGGMFFLSIFLRLQSELTGLHQRGVAVPGKVEEVDPSRQEEVAAGGGPTIRYSYTVEGRRFESTRHSVRRGATLPPGMTYAAGDTVQVIYDRAHPERSVIRLDGSIQWIPLIAGVLATLLYCEIAAYLWRSWNDGNLTFIGSAGEGCS